MERAINLSLKAFPVIKRANALWFWELLLILLLYGLVDRGMPAQFLQERLKKFLSRKRVLTYIVYMVVVVIIRLLCDAWEKKASNIYYIMHE